MVHPSSQTVTANEGEPLDIIVEFCARPSYTKVLWISEEHVYTPDAPSRDGVRALAIEVNLHVPLYQTLFACLRVWFLNLRENNREIRITQIHLIFEIIISIICNSCSSLLMSRLSQRCIKLFNTSLISTSSLKKKNYMLKLYFEAYNNK